MDIGCIGSSLSQRGFSRLGASLSVLGIARIASSLSVLDYASFGASLSLRSFSRLGAYISVNSQVKIGGKLSVGVDNTVNINIGGRSQIVPTSGLQFATATTQISYDAGPNEEMRFFVGGSKAMTLSYAPTPVPAAPTGTLHGTWTSEGAITSSDRRLKENITPIRETMTEAMTRVLGGGGSTASANVEKPEKWLLRELRPVSYELKAPDRQGAVQFGFVAQELQ